jgi:hypothetical protein
MSIRSRTVSSRRVWAVALLAALASFASATTWIVDASNGPGTNFTTISAAIAAAIPGDVIVVRPGHYPEFLTINKGITIVGWHATSYPMGLPPSPVTHSIDGGVLVTGIPAGARCLLSGLIVTRPSTGGGYSVGIVSSPGVVVIDRIVIPNGGIWIESSSNVFLESAWIRHQQGAIPPVPGVSILNSWVQANDLNATGGDVGAEPDFYAAAAPALEAFANSLVALARPKLLGGFGGGPWITSPASPAGGPAIRTSGSIVSIIDEIGSSSYLVGGQGGFRGSGSSPVIPSGNGGNGVEAFSSGVVANKLPMPVAGGAPGAHLAGGLSGGPGLAAFTSSGGVYAPVIDVPATFKNVSATVSNGFWVLSHRAAGPGYPVALAVMLEHDLFPFPPAVQFGGGNPLTAIALAIGTSNGAGYLEYGVGLPPIPVSLAGTAVVVQTADDVGNILFLANASTWVLGF